MDLTKLPIKLIEKSRALISTFSTKMKKEKKFPFEGLLLRLLLWQELALRTMRLQEELCKHMSLIALKKFNNSFLPPKKTLIFVTRTSMTCTSFYKSKKTSRLFRIVKKKSF